MRIAEARVRNYRCVLDSGWFAVEDDHTVLVGPNEAGKTAVLQALLRVNPPAGVSGYDPAIDVPHRLDGLDRDQVSALPVVTVRFSVTDDDRDVLPSGFEDATYVVERRMGNGAAHWIDGGPEVGRYTTTLHRDLTRLATHADARRLDRGDIAIHMDEIEYMTSQWVLDSTRIDGPAAAALDAWLPSVSADIDAGAAIEVARVAEAQSLTQIAKVRAAALSLLAERVPMFVYFDSRFTAGFGVDIRSFADRYDHGLVAPTQQDLADVALFRLLDMTPRQLADIEDGPRSETSEDLQRHADAVADRDRRLSDVGEALTRQLRMVWKPSGDRVEASTIEAIVTDGRLTLTARDDGSVAVPLQHRSSGFRWIVSFLVVFLAESTRSLHNTVVMLDEPGTSLHPGKQAEFRSSLRRLGRLHQTLYTTHSPHLIDPGDLDRVRSIEHISTETGTTVHTGGGAVDRAVTAPLLEAVGFRLADELFATRSAVLFASLTDYWYTNVAIDLLAPESAAFAEAELLPVGPIGQLVTLSAFLGTQGVDVVALVDSDGAGVGPDLIARRVNGANVVRPASALERTGPATVEDLVAHTLIDRIAPTLGWAVPADADRTRPVLSLLESTAGVPIDRRRLARAFVDWAATAGPDDIDPRDRQAWATIVELLEGALA